jgi:hypothetical protein
VHKCSALILMRVSRREVCGRDRDDFRRKKVDRKGACYVRALQRSRPLPETTSRANKRHYCSPICS